MGKVMSSEDDYGRVSRKGLEVLFAALHNFLRVFLLPWVYRGRREAEIGLGGIFVSSICLYFQNILS